MTLLDVNDDDESRAGSDTTLRDAPLAPVALGAVSALAGAGLAEIGQWARTRRAERVSESGRVEDRRAELWLLSLPAATKVREVFAYALRVSAPPRYWEPPEPGPDFDDTFPETWEGHHEELRREVALIPSDEYRLALESVGDAIDVSYGLARKGGYAASTQEAVHLLAQIGFDTASSWMRDERTIDAALRRQLDEVNRATEKMDKQYRIELEEQLDTNSIQT